MKIASWVGLSLLVCGVPVFGQDAPKDAAEAKSSAPEKATTKLAELAEKQQQLQKANRELEEAQRAIQSAQRDAQHARNEVARALRQQNDREKALAGVKIFRHYTPQKPFGTTATRSNANAPQYYFRGAVNGPEATQFFNTYGLDLVAADAVLRAQLSLPDDQGLVVVAVKPGGLADRSGIKEKDVIIKVNGRPVGKVEQVRDDLVKVGSGSVILALIREGKVRDATMVGPELGTPTTPTTYWIGVPVAPVDATLRSHLTALPADAGLIATDVVADSPATKAGIQKNDILLKFNNQPINSQETLVDLVQKSNGQEAKLEVLRRGKLMTLTLTPEKRAASPNEAVTSDQVIKTLIDELDDLVNWDGRSLNLQFLDERMIGKVTVDQFSTELAREMKLLTTHIEQLQKDIAAMSKLLPDGKEAKKQD